MIKPIKIVQQKLMGESRPSSSSKGPNQGKTASTNFVSVPTKVAIRENDKKSYQTSIIVPLPHVKIDIFWFSISLLLLLFLC
jgi:hypothetical protein